jgi:hypothetical protein
MEGYKEINFNNNKNNKLIRSNMKRLILNHLIL